ncbi:hypothetical protein Tco_0600291 [Tanacetum coccineum]|uniref:Uncharacterized protein n=1 Tax=Tanacetum coccineum TaxID=301880 RepID=A0ABQ4WBG6_9ASTR
MDDPNITMEEYIRLEEEKTRRCGKVYNWETATYGKIWYDEDVHDLRSVETEFPAIAFNDTLMSEFMVSSLNNEIGFRISFDESDDEDYTVIYEKILFSYKIISVNNLKAYSENDYEKVNMPLFPPPEPTVSCFDDLDFFKDFENEFPAIIYNNAQTSKSDLLTEPSVSPQHIDEFDLKDETSLSKCDEEEQHVLCFIDLFPYNVIYLMIQNWTRTMMMIKSISNTLCETVYTAYLNPMDTAYLLSGCYPVFIFSTVDMAYSLNEYNVFDTGPRERNIDEYW